MLQSFHPGKFIITLEYFIGSIDLAQFLFMKGNYNDWS